MRKCQTTYVKIIITGEDLVAVSVVRLSIHNKQDGNKPLVHQNKEVPAQQRQSAMLAHVLPE
jgi:hypothetical protein